MKRLLLLSALPLLLVGCGRSTGEMTRDAVQTRTYMADEAEGRALIGAPTSATNTVVENALAIPDLSVLVGALRATDLTETLGGDGPYTVFAPINQAFNLIDAGDMISMDMDEDAKMQLRDLLLDHVAEGSVTAGDLSEGMTVVTLGEADYGITRSPTDPLMWQIGGADIVVADIESSNGVIHLINLVLDEEGFFRQ